MKQSVIHILACPWCTDKAGTLRLYTEEIQDEDILSGSLTCEKCQRIFPIQAGIPCFLTGRESSAVRQAFSQQWHMRYQGKFERDSRVFWIEHQEALNYLTQRISLDFPASAYVLDAGCGSGEKALHFAQRYPHVQMIAMDISDTLGNIAQQAQALPNLHVIQGDVMYPPFKMDVFLLVISIGVLHHTAAPYQAFQALARLVISTGRMVVWLYPDPSESPFFQKFYYFFRDVLFLGKGHALSPRLRLWILRLLCLPLFLLMPFFLFSKWIHQNLYQNLQFSDLYKGLVFMLYDNLAPQYQFRHKKEEVLGWYATHGFSKAQECELGLYMGDKN